MAFLIGDAPCPPVQHLPLLVHSAEVTPGSYFALFEGKAHSQGLQSSPPYQIADGVVAKEGKVGRALIDTCKGLKGDGAGLDLTDGLEKITAPSLIIAGRLDPFVPWTETAKLAAWLPGATFLLIGKGGHTPFKAGGQCLADIVDQFARGKKLDTSCLKKM